MAYECIASPPTELYHYTKKENVDSILIDGKIRRFKDKECWFCTSLDDTLRLMELTVMNEGGFYIGVNGFPLRYPKFIPDDYVVLKPEPRYQNGEWIKWHQEVDAKATDEQKELAEEFGNLKIGYRGNLKFKQNPEIFEISEVLQIGTSDAHTLQDFCY